MATQDVRSNVNDQDLIPLRMLVEYVYCPRLFYLMHVEGQMLANAPVWRGRIRHKDVDKPGKRAARRKPKQTTRSQSTSATAEDDHADAQELPDHWTTITALDLGSNRLGIVGKLDTVLLDPVHHHAVPAELKSGKRPEPDRHRKAMTQEVWTADAVHVCAQSLLLEEAGYDVPHAEIYYAQSKSLRSVSLTPDLKARTLRFITEARLACVAPLPPPPLEDSPKCPECSLLPVCLPEETAWIRKVGASELPNPDGAEPPVRRVLPPLLEERSVVVTTPGAWVRKEGDALRIDVPWQSAERIEATESTTDSSEGSGRSRGEKSEGGEGRSNVPQERATPTRVPLSAVQELVIMGRANVTVPAIIACLEQGAPVSFMTGWGRLTGIATPMLGNNVQLRIAQHRFAQSSAQSLALARSFITGKLRNQRTLVRRNHPALPDEVRNELASLIRAAATAENHDQLLGLEGRGARVYFKAFSEIVHERSEGVYTMQGRSRRPPRDRVNALLSFGYGVLVKDLTAITARVGFDPLIGFLHQPGYGRSSLALDLVEEFRPLIVDSTVLRVISRSMIKPQQFREEAGGLLLLPPARRAFLRALDQRKQELVVTSRAQWQRDRLPVAGSVSASVACLA